MKGVVTLNVGGKIFQTLRSTLENIPYFEKCFTTLVGKDENNNKEFFIDLDPKIFRHWLNSVRETDYEVPVKYALDVERMRCYFYASTLGKTFVDHEVRKKRSLWDNREKHYSTLLNLSLYDFPIDYDVTSGKSFKVEKIVIDEILLDSHAVTMDYDRSSTGLSLYYGDDYELEFFKMVRLFEESQMFNKRYVKVHPRTIECINGIIEKSETLHLKFSSSAVFTQNISTLIVMFTKHYKETEKETKYANETK